MRFTADDAFEVQGTEDAIMLQSVAAERICRNHDASFNEFLADTLADPEMVDAGALLAWLGY